MTVSDYPIKSYTASAPGRLDVMGGIADYSGSLVLQLPLKEQTHVTVRITGNPNCKLVSDTPDGKLSVSIDFDQLLVNGLPDYQYARNYFSARKNQKWTAYILGCVLILIQEKKIPFNGADFQIHSAIPLGKGVSSSAALEIATLRALALAYNIDFTGTELATLAQRVENIIVGAPCGLMDQLTSAFGHPESLLPIICRPDQLLTPVPVPEGIVFIGIDSGIRHAVGSSSYADVRSAAFMGYTIIARSLGLTASDIAHYRLTGDRALLPFNGYLSGIDNKDFNEKFFSLLPEKMSGADFISAYGDTIDLHSQIEPETEYLVQVCASHPVEEHARVNTFLNLLQSYSAEQDSSILTEMGDLMKLSHQSYSACGLGTKRTDEIVTMASKYLEEGVFGAKITGGGSGGVVCLLTSGDDGREAALDIRARMEKRHKTTLRFFG